MAEKQSTRPRQLRSSSGARKRVSISDQAPLVRNGDNQSSEKRKKANSRRYNIPPYTDGGQPATYRINKSPAVHATCSETDLRGEEGIVRGVTYVKLIYDIGGFPRTFINVRSITLGNERKYIATYYDANTHFKTKVGPKETTDKRIYQKTVNSIRPGDLVRITSDLNATKNGPKANLHKVLVIDRAAQNGSSNFIMKDGLFQILNYATPGGRYPAVRLDNNHFVTIKDTSGYAYTPGTNVRMTKEGGLEAAPRSDYKAGASTYGSQEDILSLNGDEPIDKD